MHILTTFAPPVVPLQGTRDGPGWETGPICSAAVPFSGIVSVDSTSTDAGVRAIPHVQPSK